MNLAHPMRAAGERFAQDVRQALRHVPPEVASSALGPAMLAESLLQIAGDILNAQGNSALLDQLGGARRSSRKVMSART